MARYRIQFTYTGNPSDTEILTINFLVGAVPDSFTHQFNSSGSAGTNPVLINAVSFQGTAYNHRESFRVNYNLGGVWNVPDPGADQWEIEGEFDAQPTTGSLPTNMSIVYTLLNDQINITSLGINKNVADTCNWFDVLITADKVFDEVYSPSIVAETFPDTLTHTITLERDKNYTVSVRDSDGEVSHKPLLTPSYLNAGLIEIKIFNNQVTILDDTRDLYPLQYSLDNSNWQTDPTFDGLPGGDYDLYVKDQYDCQFQTTFSLEEGVDGVITIPDPYFKYSKANAIRMAKREQWDDIVIHKNSDNTLSCEVIDEVVHIEKQRWRSTDTPQLQMKNNYSDLKVITSNDRVEQTIVQMTNNIGVKSSMDCKIVDLGDNQYGIYFISGKTYDYDTGTDLNADYNLNGQLPQFAKVGGIITISNFNYTIQEINFNQDLEVMQIVISSTILVGITSGIVKAVYNVFGYEVYEVSIDLSGRDEFNIEIWYDGVIQWASELQVIDDESTNLIYLEWFMTYNTDMFWATSIVQKARMLSDTINGAPMNESESYETDSDSILVETDNFEVDVFKFIPLTKEVAKALVLWLSHNELTLRGLKYRKDSIEMEGLGHSNLYVVTAKMVLRGTGLYEERTDSANIEIPALLQTDLDGYIKIN